MGRFEANLPDVLVPDGEICVNVRIPNHPDYVKLFVRAMRMLEVNRMYQRDEDHSAAIVCEQWRTRTLTPLIEALATGNGCPEDTNEYDCIEYPAFASFIEYVPLSPFQVGAPVPPNYLTYPWWKWSTLDTVLPDWIDNPINDFIEDLTQYQPNDAITWLGGLPYNGLGEIIDNAFPFPYIKIHVTGKGSIRMNFLSFPLGGRIMTEVDEMPNILDILTSSFLDPDSRVIDTDRDMTTFPMEQWPLIGVKLEIEEEGDHIVYCMVLPKVEAGIDFFGFGGGLRSVELCNGLRPINVPEPPPPPLLEGVTELKPEFQLTAECGMEYRLRDQDDNIVQDWTPVAGWVENAAACFTPEGGEMATKDDIRDGIVEAAEIIGLRIGMGEILPFSVDEDGEVTVGGEAGEEGLPEDNPLTPIDETDAAHYGGVFALGTKLEEVVDRADLMYGPVNGTPANAEALAQQNMKLYFPCDAALMDAAITSYYAYRATNSQLAFNGGTDFFQHLFCNGYDINSINRFMIGVRTFSTAKTLQISNILSALLPEFWSDNFERGTNSPSTQYLDAACVKTPSQEILVMPLSTNRQFFGLKANHRILLTFRGYVTDSDGDLQDSFWFRTAAGVLTRSNPTFGYGAGVAQPSDNEVPYNSAHIYQFTMQLPNSSTTMTINIGENAGIGTPIYQPEQFSIDFEDFGLPYGS